MVTVGIELIRASGGDGTLTITGSEGDYHGFIGSSVRSLVPERPECFGSPLPLAPQPGEQLVWKNWRDRVNFMPRAGY